MSANLMSLARSGDRFLKLYGDGKMVCSWRNPYVTDGLIAMWDGEWNAGGGIHDPDATMWKDLVSGMTFKSAIPTVAMSSGEDSFVVREGTFAVLSVSQFSDALSSVFVTGNKTIELIVDVDFLLYGSSAHFITGFGQQWNVDAISFYDRKIDWGQVNNATFSGFIFQSKQGKNSFCVTPTKAFHDGVFTGKEWPNGSSRANLTKRIVLGEKAWGNGSDFDITYHALRIYNRTLTPAEIAANYAIDKARFGLPD